MFKWLKNLFVDKEAEERKLRELRLREQAAKIVQEVVAAQARERKGFSQRLTANDFRQDSDVRYSFAPLTVEDTGTPPRAPGQPGQEPAPPRPSVGGVPRHRAKVWKADFSSVKQEKTFAQRLNELVNSRCGGMPSTCYSRAGVRRQTYSKIISTGGGNVTKRIAMQLCIGAHANIREAMELLESAGYAFSKASYEDAVFRWCLENGVYSMTYLNELLVHCNCKPCDLVF